jgi:hypothetical protein
MDFKPYTEVVLPPEKGTGIPQRNPRSPEKEGVSKPREFQVQGSPTESPQKAPEAKERPAAPTEPPEKRLQKNPRHVPRPAQPEPHQDFLIAYDGKFLGQFRPAKRITNRTAFCKVARELLRTVEDFDIGKLALYKAVPLHVELPPSLPEVNDGSFCWFAEHKELEHQV